MLSVWVSIDAFVVLAGAVLTSYVGINGLIRRMSLDRCLPQFFLKKNPYTHTDSFILVSFFVLCVSQVILLDSDVEALGGVYCYAFLSVMSIFAFGNILLKIKRPSLPREIKVPYSQSLLGLVAVVIALLGNILGKPELLTYVRAKRAQTRCPPRPTPPRARAKCATSPVAGGVRGRVRYRRRQQGG